MKKKERYSRLIGLLIILFIVINFLPTGYLILSPGVAQELSPIITVEEGYKNSQGRFMLTAVASQRATVWDYIKIKLFKPQGVDLERMEEQLPPGMDLVEYLEIMNKLMEDSKLKAQAVAFQRAGLEIKFEGQGAVIDEVLADGSAVGKLQEGDIIVAIDDQAVKIDEEAVKLIREHEIGEEVKITVLRENVKRDYTLKTVEMSNNPGKPSIGVMIYTDYEYEFPREVHFSTENIAGPSAGGMFALEIYNQLTAEDLTKGRMIAGTGTISLDGSIGEIDGIKQKVMAAEEKGAEIFLLPVENYEEAQKYSHNLTLVPVKTIDEAIKYLKEN